MKLRGYQRECITAVREWWDGGNPNALVVLPTGGGKALRVDQRVLTPTGWRAISSLKVGDMVIGSNGHPTRVEGVFPQGVRPMVEVEVTDGATIVCDEDHLWTVRTKYDRTDGIPWRTAPLRDLIAAGITDRQGGARWELPSVEPVEHPPTGFPFHPNVGLPLDPYLLGVLLGDGGLSTRGRVLVTTEPDLAETLVDYLPPPATLSFLRPEGKAATYYIGGPTGRGSNPVLTAVRALGLEGHTAHSKFIPEAYLFAPAFARLALLQGLMDTDGSVGRRGTKVEITLVSRALAEGVQALVRSLGGRASLRPKKTSWSSKGEKKTGLAWRVIVGLMVCPFRWKAGRWKARTKYDCARRIVAARPAGEGEAVCIKVAADDGLFVTEGYVLTHNTVVFSCIGKELRNEGLRKILVLAHRTELVTQAVAKWRKVDPSERIGIYQGSRREVHCDVIAASVASCYPDVYRWDPCSCTVGGAIIGEDGWPTGKAEKLEPRPDCPACEGGGEVRNFVRRGRIHELPLADIDLVIIDEVHHAVRDSLYWKVIEAIREVNPIAMVLGVTATPYRADKQGLGHLFDGACFSRGIKWMCENEFLAPPYGERIALKIDLSGVRTSKGGDFREDDLGDVMDTPGARSEIVAAWIEKAGPGTYIGDPRGRPTAVFCPTVAAAEHLCEEFNGHPALRAAGIRADWICGDKKLCPDDRRHRILGEFDRGELPIVVNVGVLTEGWDAQRTACILVARPTKSIGLYVQIVGRGLRWLGESGTKEESTSLGKADCLVLDCTGASSLGLVSLADLSDSAGVEPKKKKAPAETRLEEEQGELEIETKRVIGYSSFEVDLFGGGVEWCRINGSRVAGLDAGKTIVVFEGPDGFSAIVAAKELLELVHGVGEKEALRAAEAYAAEHGQRRFLKPGAWFQKKPATEKQRIFLRKLIGWSSSAGVAVPDPGAMSMQEASAWAGYLLARKQYADTRAARRRAGAAA